MTRDASLQIRLGALSHNLAVARRAAPGRRLLAVVKADAYGHGLVRVAQALDDTDGFAVARLAEAGALRTAGVGQPILLLEGVADGEELAEAARLDVMLVVHSSYQVELLARTRLSRPLHIWLKVDSGMHRLGVAPERAGELWRRLAGLDTVAGTVRWMTHFSSADDLDKPTTSEQMACFDTAIGELPGERSLANSAGLLGWPASHGDWVRPGIMLYGASPFVGRTGAQDGLRPVMQLDSYLIAVHRRRRGERIGYGGAGVCEEEMMVGVAAIGYGDGYPRHARQGTPVLVNGIRAALIGRVSMDMVTLDLRTVPGARVGDPVRLWGDGLPAEEIAESAGTIAYELFCGVTTRVPRIYIDSV